MTNYSPTNITVNSISAKNSIDINGSNVLTNKTLSNCITEIPQYINLELTSSSCKLKTGSKVYFPNGSNVFDSFTLTSDLTLTQAGTATDVLYFVHPNKSTVVSVLKSSCYSGDTQPSGTNYAFWYDTTNNKVGMRASGSSTFTFGYSLPICVATIADSLVTSIDQLFNGFGYIGSTVFALPGVKGLAPNGRNADGSLKNVEVILSNVLLRTFTDTATTEFAIHTSGIYQHSRYIVKDDNYLYYEDGTKINTPLFVAGEFSRESGRITSLTPKTAFHAVDYQDAVLQSSLATCHVVVETYVNGTDWYRIYDDNWIEQGGRLERSGTGIQNVTFLKPFANLNYNIQATNRAAESYTSASTFYPPYTLNHTISGFSMSSNAAIASIKYFEWVACGFIS